MLKADRARQEAEAEAARKIAEAEAKAKAEIEAAKAEQERIEAERLATEQRKRDEQARRAADLEHRKTINGSARDTIIQVTGLSKVKAELLVAAIVSGGIPAVSIQY